MIGLHAAYEIFRDLPTFLNSFAGDHPVGVYALLVAIVFCETGLVIWPFLPGDSLLFAVGTLAANGGQGGSLHLPALVGLLCLAANGGDLLNYFVGRRLGPAIFRRQDSWLLNKKHLLEAQAFYERHGRKTIIIARFVPIIRTFAPFVAGIGKMRFSRFIGFSVAGGVFWVTTVLLAGYEFGHFEAVKKHFELVILGIVAVSMIPVVVSAMGRSKAPGLEAVGPPSGEQN
jgi:membrane-associated protein